MALTAPNVTARIQERILRTGVTVLAFRRTVRSDRDVRLLVRHTCWLLRPRVIVSDSAFDVDRAVTMRVIALDCSAVGSNVIVYFSPGKYAANMLECVPA